MHRRARIETSQRFKRDRDRHQHDHPAAELPLREQLELHLSAQTGAARKTPGRAGYQAATFSGTLSPKTSETVSFSVGADDVAFVYLNGQMVCDLGGVHPDTPGTCTTGMLTAGTSNSLEIFYADLRPAAAPLNFSLVTTNVTVCPAGTTGPSCTPTTTGRSPGGSTGVPEPATLPDGPRLPRGGLVAAPAHPGWAVGPRLIQKKREANAARAMRPLHRGRFHFGQRKKAHRVPAAANFDASLLRRRRIAA